MKSIKLLLKWVYGIIFLIAGASILFSTSFVGGILFLICGLVVFPPTLKRIDKKLGKELGRQAKYGIVIFSFLGGTIFFAINQVEKDEANGREVDKIVQEAKTLIEKGNMQSAIKKISEAKEKYSSQDNKAVELENLIEKSKSYDYAKEVLADMSDENFERLKKRKLVNEYFELEKLNQDFIKLLQENISKRNEIIREVEQKREQERIRKEQEKLATEKAERKQKIERQFSSLDGSHPALSRSIKENCRNPKSYEHIETRFRDDGNSIFVITKYRAENGFGGMSIGTVSARVDFDGNVIEIVSQD